MRGRATPGGAANPLRVAIIGSGPSGFYAAGHLLRDDVRVVQVDMYDRLPTPWGLVRGGVAPDHPKIKAVSRVFERTAGHSEFRFHGNVEVGRTVSVDELRDRYHAIVYAVGAEADRRLGVPGEDLPGSLAATELVAWYNGHPDHRDLEVDLSAERAVVVGNGNVAMDVARMLATDPEELARTDVADHALAALRRSRVREIVLVGRRGPAQAAFTNPELLELRDMTGADVVVDPLECELDPLSAESIEGEGHATERRNVEILREYACAAPRERHRRIMLRFFVAPVEILGADRVRGVRVVHNELYRDGAGALHVRATSRIDEIDCGLVFRSIGYRGVPLPDVPFDHDRAVIPNDRGRVIDSDGPRPGEFVVGWIKRGANGVIGTNKRDARETVERIVEDLEAGALREPVDPSRASLEALLAERVAGLVDYRAWLAIDEHERAAGALAGRPRVKLCEFEDLLRAAGMGAA